MTSRAADVVDDTSPNVARVYDYILGGKDNFAVDREAANQLLTAFPEAREAARAGRAFLGRVVEYFVREAGIRQFVDIGSGLPTQQNVHEVAQAVSPDVRVVYVDNDPVVCAHGRALLEGGDLVAVVEADLRDPEKIIADPATRRLIDFSQPVVLLLVSILHLISDDDDPVGVVAQLRDAVAPGSYLVFSHMLETEQRRPDTDKAKKVYSRANSGVYPRTLEQVMRFTEGLELVDMTRFVDRELMERYSGIGWGAVGRKP